MYIWNMEQQCGYCGFFGKMIFVHSHYQCPRCGINIAPCCEGENCQELEHKKESGLGKNDENMKSSL